jgi:hypothetical protein
VGRLHQGFRANRNGSSKWPNTLLLCGAERLEFHRAIWKVDKKTLKLCADQRRIVSPLREMED